MPQLNTRTLMAAALTFPCAAMAADLVNQDDREYKVRIHDVGTTHSSIGGNTTQTSVCGSCRIEVEGAGSVEVSSGDSRVVISGGSVSKE